MTANLSIGCFTPPFGINIFVAQAVFKQPVSVIYPGVAPFIVVSVDRARADHLCAGAVAGPDEAARLSQRVGA